MVEQRQDTKLGGVASLPPFLVVGKPLPLIGGTPLKSQLGYLIGRSGESSEAATITFRDRASNSTRRSPHRSVEFLPEVFDT